MMVVYVQRLNINGTSGSELLDQYKQAALAVSKAFRAVQNCAPHGRDFQTIEPVVYRLARQQHNRWLSQLDDMYNEIEQVGMDIYAQMPPY